MTRIATIIASALMLLAPSAMSAQDAKDKNPEDAAVGMDNPTFVPTV